MVRGATCLVLLLGVCGRVSGVVQNVAEGTMEATGGTCEANAEGPQGPMPLQIGPLESDAPCKDKCLRFVEHMEPEPLPAGYTREFTDDATPAEKQEMTCPQFWFSKADGEIRFENGFVMPPASEHLAEQVAEVFVGSKTTQDHKTAFLLMGGPGSGKSYAVDNALCNRTEFKDACKNAVHIDPDAILSAMPEFQKAINFKVDTDKNIMYTYSGAEKSSCYSMAYYIKAKYIDKKIQEGSLNFIFDATGNNKISYQEYFGLMESYDRIVLFFVDTDRRVAIERANSRAAKVGRQVDADYVQKLYDGIHSNFLDIASYGCHAMIEDGGVGSNKFLAYHYVSPQDGVLEGDNFPKPLACVHAGDMEVAELQHYPSAPMLQ